LSLVYRQYMHRAAEWSNSKSLLKNIDNLDLTKMHGTQ